MPKFGNLDWTRMMRGEALSQGNRLKEFELGTAGDSLRQVILLGSCKDVANAINRSLLDPTSIVNEGPGSWPYCINAEIRDPVELTDLLTLFREILTLTRTEGLDEAFALDFHTDPGSETGGIFNRTAIGELALQGKYRSNREAGSALADRLSQVALAHPRLRQTTVVVSVEGTNNTFGEQLAGGVARRMNVPFIRAHWTEKPKTPAKDGRANLELQNCTIDGDFNDDSVLIVDDMWRTGVSLKSVAAQARAMGADEVFGLCCTRTLRN
jgi:adenine/guanine phosphoribosyltransferase-like PRPP-binding protein